MFKKTIKQVNKENRFFMKKWNQHEKEDSKKEEDIKIKKEKVKQTSFFYIEKNKDISLPDPGFVFRILVKRVPSEIFLFKICENEIIEELTIAIFSISRKIVLSISKLIEEGKIKKVNILVSDMWAKLKRESDYLFLIENIPNVNLGSERIHTKIMLAKTCQNFYCYEGSGNLSTNTNYEQYIFENHFEAYDFHYEWILRFIKNYRENGEK